MPDLRNPALFGTLIRWPQTGQLSSACDDSPELPIVILLCQSATLIAMTQLLLTTIYPTATPATAPAQASPKERAATVVLSATVLRLDKCHDLHQHAELPSSPNLTTNTPDHSPGWRSNPYWSYKGHLERPLLQDYRFYLPMRNTLVPHLGHTPWVAGRLFFILIALGFLISTFLLHFTQYACIWTSLRLRFVFENNINMKASQ